jgi:hypothetical protein
MFLAEIARQDGLEAFEERPHLCLLRQRRLLGVRERHGMDREPQRRAPDGRRNTVARAALRALRRPFWGGLFMPLLDPFNPVLD